MGFREKLSNIGGAQVLEGAQRLQNYMQSINTSLTGIEEALNHNTQQIGQFLRRLDERVENIEKKIGILEEGDDGKE